MAAATSVAWARARSPSTIRSRRIATTPWVIRARTRPSDRSSPNSRIARSSASSVAEPIGELEGAAGVPGVDPGRAERIRRLVHQVEGSPDQLAGAVRLDGARRTGGLAWRTGPPWPFCRSAPRGRALWSQSSRARSRWTWPPYRPRRRTAWRPGRRAPTLGERPRQVVGGVPVVGQLPERPRARLAAPLGEPRLERGAAVGVHPAALARHQVVVDRLAQQAVAKRQVALRGSPRRWHRAPRGGRRPRPGRWSTSDTSARSSGVDAAAHHGGVAQQDHGSRPTGRRPGSAAGRLEGPRQGVAVTFVSSSSTYSGLPSEPLEDAVHERVVRSDPDAAQRGPRHRRGRVPSGRVDASLGSGPGRPSPAGTGGSCSISSERNVSSRPTGPRAVLATEEAKSIVERSAQCRSSSTTSTGPSAASSSTASPSSSTVAASLSPVRYGDSRRVTGASSSADRPTTAWRNASRHRPQRHAVVDVEGSGRPAP